MDFYIHTLDDGQITGRCFVNLDQLLDLDQGRDITAGRFCRRIHTFILCRWRVSQLIAVSPVGRRRGGRPLWIGGLRPLSCSEPRHSCWFRNYGTFAASWSTVALLSRRKVGATRPSERY